MIRKTTDLFISIFLAWLMCCLIIGVAFCEKQNIEEPGVGGGTIEYIPEEQYESQKMFDSVAPTLSPVPFSPCRQITSWFGLRYIDGSKEPHTGIDIGCPDRPHCRILAAGSGRVTDVWIWHPRLGKCVIIRHDNGYETLYAHFDETFVYEGQYVQAGQQIGVMGNTGRSTGRHLHYEVRRYGLLIDPLDVMREQPDEEGKF